MVAGAFLMGMTDFAPRGPVGPDGAGVDDIVLSSVHNLALVYDTAPFPPVPPVPPPHERETGPAPSAGRAA
jgi:hypothetical protein